MSRGAQYELRNKAAREFLLDEGRARKLAPPTAEVVPAQAKELGVKWEVEDVPDGRGAKLHWLGDRNAKTVILYFHGTHTPHSLCRLFL